jgi:hypothetical protein
VREAKGVALAYHRFGFSGFSPPGFAIRLRQHSLAEPARRRCRKLSRPKPCQLSNIGNELTHKPAKRSDRWGGSMARCSALDREDPGWIRKYIPGNAVHLANPSDNGENTLRLSAAPSNMEQFVQS